MPKLAPFGFLISRLLAGNTNVDVIINALEDKGIARMLAEPNLVALSGDTASFLAGGEFPIPVPGALGQVTIDYKRYGVGLAFTPTVLSNGLINMKIEPEVSQLDTSKPVQVAGISVPPLIVRRASTTVELRDGQSFVIGGLLQSQGETAPHRALGPIELTGSDAFLDHFRELVTDDAQRGGGLVGSGPDMDSPRTIVGIGELEPVDGIGQAPLLTDLLEET